MCMLQAKAMVLSALAPQERTELMRGMSDEEAAACLVRCTCSRDLYSLHALECTALSLRHTCSGGLQSGDCVLPVQAAMSLGARGAVLADLSTADPTLVTCALAAVWCASRGSLPMQL